MPSAAAVETRDLRRVFTRGGRETPALGGVSLRIEPGEVHGLLGPNGAGKTTLVRILATILLPTSGTASVFGHGVTERPAEVRRLVGIVLGGDRGLYPRLTARQNLEFFCALYDLGRREARRKSDALLERFGLRERADDRVETFSRGMKQRLHLARGLVGEPQVLFLDEPTVGLDPAAAHAVRRVIEELASEGRTLLLATHDMIEAESLCDRVTLIDRGAILATAEPDKLRSLRDSVYRIEVRGLVPSFESTIAEIAGVLDFARGDEDTTVIEVASRETVPAVLRVLADAGVSEITTAPPTLEEVYLEFVGGRGLEVA